MSTLSVLIIDDDVDDKEMLCEAVVEINNKFCCEWARSGLEAIEVLTKTGLHPNVIFLDLNMPGINGKQCLTKLRANKEWADIPIYIYSTSKLEADINETIGLGATGFITKPSTYGELKQSLIAILTE